MADMGAWDARAMVFRPLAFTPEEIYTHGEHSPKKDVERVSYRETDYEEISGRGMGGSFLHYGR